MSMERENGPGSLRSNARLKLLAAALIALLALAIDMTTALRLDDSGVLDQYDVIFHADTGARLDCAVRSECAGRSSFAHPALALVFDAPAKGFGTFLAVLGGFEGDVAAARRFAVIVLSPIFSAAKSGLLLLFASEAGLSLAASVILALAGTFSFSQLVFGSVPDSFALSGLLITAALFFGVRAFRHGRSSLWKWIVIASMAGGVTVTNIVAVALVLFWVLYYIEGKSAALRGAIAVSIGAAIVCSALGFLSLRLFDLREMSLAGGREYVTRWLAGERSKERFVAMPVTLAHTIAAPMPRMFKNDHAARTRAPYRFRFAYSPPPFFASREPGVWLILAALVFCFVRSLRAGPLGRFLAAATGSIVGFNWILHSVWGTDIILYSQHWHSALIAIAAGPFLRSSPAAKRKCLIIYIVAVAAVLWLNSHTLSGMFEELGKARTLRLTAARPG